MSRREIITRADIERAHRECGLPLVCNPERLAGLLMVSKKTIYIWRAAGRLEGTYRKRGKYLLFNTDKVLDLIFNGPKWEPTL